MIKPYALTADVTGVGLSDAKRHAIRRGVREMLVRAGAAAGVVLGLLWALQRPAPATPAACRGQGERIGGCFNEALLATAWPYVAGIALGLAAGALIGALVSHLLRT